MRIADQWKDYEIIDTSGGEKLERWGDVLLIRPDPQIIWNTPKRILPGKRRMPDISAPMRAAAAGKIEPWTKKNGKFDMGADL